ncbi:YidC/Oxa1 family membrane protein insertase [Leucobacter aridicollis]|uniref:YidC/Oxa1 family membrane protein insertase n=1 Tax=Leucobacter aridicollis TaxID=283878 RepID=UPI002101D69D|nr:YidC/Oxa1 family membrane protein insertase [Leucobacter aridicollis]UTX51965.1 membrane protein insertase YidC [Leucobacter aridicollis]
MNIYEFLPIKLLIRGAYWLVTTLSDLIEPLAGAQSAAIAIILLTLAVRLALIPVGRSQVKATVARQHIAPKLAELQRKYKNPEVLQRKTMELYASEKASPFAGCFPVLAQMPVLMAVYGLFILPEVDGHPNELLTKTFLGIPLDAGLAAQVAGGTVTPTHIIVGLVIVALIGAVTQTSRKLLTPPMPEPAPKPANLPAGMPDLSGMTKMMSFVPFITVVIAAIVPLAAALYLATTTTWTLCERLILGKIYGTLPSAQRGATDGRETGGARGQEA